MSIGKSHHIALRSPNWARAKAFYNEVLGFPIVGQLEGKDIVFLDIGGTTIELLPGSAEDVTERPKCGLMHLAFEVEDVDAVYAQLAAKGVQFTIEPRDVGDIRLAFFLDPDGNQLELFHSPSLSWRR